MKNIGVKFEFESNFFVFCEIENWKDTENGLKNFMFPLKMDGRQLGLKFNRNILYLLMRLNFNWWKIERYKIKAISKAEVRLRKKRNIFYTQKRKDEVTNVLMKHSICWNCKFYIHASIKDVSCLFFFLFFSSFVIVDSCGKSTRIFEWVFYFVETQSLNKYLDFLFY